MRHIPRILALLALGAVAVAGCAGGGDGRASGAQAAPATTAAPATMAGDAAATTAGGAGGGRGGYGGGDYGGQAATTAGKAGGSATGGGAGAVRIAGFAFAPRTLTAKVGQKVTWRNQDAGVTHTVTAVDGSFASGQLAEGDDFSHVFRRAGTFAYHCSIHPSMRGTVKVTG